MTCIILSILIFHIGIDPISPYFVEMTKSVGIDFTHTNGADGAYHLPETLGAGGAFFDYDNDDNLDLFLVNSGPIHGTAANTSDKSALYRNNGDGTFTDVTEQSHLDTLDGYNHGVVAADYDNDNDQDLYITSLGSNHLYQNNGDGTFTDITELSGIGSTLWSSSATFFDYVLDSYLDLYVVNYVHYRLDQTYQPCIEFGYQDYCNLRYYEGAPDQLYRNNGDGTFTDVTKSAGIMIRAVLFKAKAWASLPRILIMTDSPIYTLPTTAHQTIFFITTETAPFRKSPRGLGVPIAVRDWRRREWALTLETTTETV